MNSTTIINKKNAELIVKYVQEQPKGNRCSTGQESAEGTFQRPGGRRYAGKGEKKTQVEALCSGFDLERRSKGVSGAERTLLRRSGRT